jgi:HEPN domain-containing protein
VADDYPGAALKHLSDCKALLAVKRYDNAGYLAGYVVECAAKTVIRAEGGPLDDHLNRLTPEVLRLSALPGQRTAKYISHPKFHTMRGWYTGLRYTPTGTVSEADATTWVAEARRLYAEVIMAMKIDGVI